MKQVDVRPNVSAPLAASRSSSVTAFLAPAKLNLFLHITGRRPDGYHTLESLMMRIDWCDRLAFEILDSSVVERVDVRFQAFESLAMGQAPQPALVHTVRDVPQEAALLVQGHSAWPSLLEPEDLCVRAAKRLQAYAGCRLGARIYLEKNIPTQAGLGGGSSDAATTLLVLNQLWGLNLSVPELSALALDLGADVPFFVLQRHAWVTGVGECLQAVDLPYLHALVVKPPVGLSTHAVFAHPLLERDAPALEKKDIMASLQKDTVLQWLSKQRNSMQAAAQSMCPEILWLCQALEALGLQPRMTGSGSAVFGLSGTSLEALELSLPQGWYQRCCGNAI